MTNGNKKLTVFSGNVAKAIVLDAVDSWLQKDPTWRAYIPLLAPIMYVHPSPKDHQMQLDTTRMIRKASVVASVNACLETAVYAKDDGEDSIDSWHDLAIDLEADFEVLQVNPDGSLETVHKPHQAWGEPYAPPEDHELPKAIWLDVDGTSFTMYGEDGKPLRGPFEYHKVHLDTPLHHTINVVKALQNSGYKIVVLSGREESCKEATLKAYANVGVIPDDIFMRPNGSNIPDDVLKYQIFKEKVQPKYHIEVAFDDRDKVVKMLRTILKIPVFQVNYGAF